MPISRLFHNAADAEGAAAKLRRAGYEHVQLVGGAGVAPGADELRRHGVAQRHVDHLAERIAAGAALVIVDAPFGTGAEATDILETSGPVDTEGVGDVGYTEARPAGGDNPAPLSQALGWPVLSHDPAPLSRMLGLRVLSSSQSPGDRSHGFATLSHDPTPLSSALHVRTLTRNAAPLSSALGLGVLSRVAAPLSRALGLSVLSSNPAPLSRRLGWRELARDPAPLSRALGLKVLSGDRH